MDFIENEKEIYEVQTFGAVRDGLDSPREVKGKFSYGFVDGCLILFLCSYRYGKMEEGA
jgi:hypothetical protein